MRILCLTDFEIMPEHRWLWDCLAENKDEITFLSIHSTDKYRKWGKLVASYPKYFILAWRAFKKVQAKKFDLIVAWESDAGLPLALIKRLISNRFPPLIILTFSVRGPLSHFLGFLQFASKGIDFMTVPTRYEKEYYSNLLQYPPEKIFYCPYGTYDVFRGLPRYEKEEYVFSGGRSERDYKTLLEAISPLDIPLVINTRPFNLRRLSIPKNVIINDILPAAQFRDLNWGSRFVIVPVDEVGQAAGITSVLYGMAAGKAVIASDVPGLHDYIVEGETGLFVPPRDVRKLREAIQFLWDHQEIAKRLGQNGKEAYLQRFTFENMARRIVQTLQNL